MATYDDWKLATPPEYEEMEGPEVHEPPCPEESGCIVCYPDKAETLPAPPDDSDEGQEAGCGCPGVH